ncbi:MAG: heparinase II/III family protein [Candidatus Latescibacteria bacterium]|jgi:hypothetical protein|nr:heparinase II/III family protein [Candidatus Latescibacterota bacterium]
MDEIPRDERIVSDAEFLDALDPKRRDLAPIRRAAARGDLDRARGLLVDHFRTRRRPRWTFDLRDGRRGVVPVGWGGAEMGDPTRADDLLRNRFLIREDDRSVVWDFGPDLKWRTAEMRQLASTAYRFKRGNFFRDLIIAYSRTRRAAYAKKFSELVSRWLADWPLVVGPEFHPDSAILSRADGHDTMTTAHRWIAWLDAIYGGIAFAREVPLETVFGMIKSMWFTAIQYRTYERSKYVPANHHLWERGTAPLIFGIMLPEFPEVRRLVDQAKPVIVRHAGRSFLPDGGYEERTAGYTVSAIQMFLEPLRLARLNRVALLGRRELRALKRCSEVVAHLTLPDGSQPDIGDGLADGPRTAQLLGAATGLLRSEVTAVVAQKLGLKGHVEPEDRKAVAAVRSDRRLPLAVHYPRSGYFAARDGWSKRSSAMALSVPGRGIPNHAHDDALSLQLVVRGEPMIGTPLSELYSYLNRDQRAKRQLVRGHFYAMTSHNVVLVNGEPARSVRSLVSSWGPKPTPVRTEWEAHDRGVRVRCAHRGYPDTRLSREIDFEHKKGWTVRDEVRGAEGKPHIARWHFEYGVEISEEDGCFVAERGRARLEIRFAAEGRCRARLYRDTRWLGKNPMRPGEPAPWVLDVRFGGTGRDWLETEFRILTLDH